MIGNILKFATEPGKAFGIIYGPQSLGDNGVVLNIIVSGTRENPFTPFVHIIEKQRFPEVLETTGIDLDVIEVAHLQGRACYVDISTPRPTFLGLVPVVMSSSVKVIEPA